MRSATIWTSPQSPQRRCCAHVRGKTWVGSPAPARASGNASRVQYLAVRCANAGSVRPVIHRPGRLPEGRDAGPSLEPGWRSTVPRTADQPYVSFAQRGAVSEGIQLPALPRCRYVRPCTCCGRYSVGYGDPSAAPPVAWITFHKGHQAPLLALQPYCSETQSIVAMRQSTHPSMGCHARQLSPVPCCGRQRARTPMSGRVLSTPAIPSSPAHCSRRT